MTLKLNKNINRKFIKINKIIYLLIYYTKNAIQTLMSDELKPPTQRPSRVHRAKEIRLAFWIRITGIFPLGSARDLSSRLANFWRRLNAPGMRAIVYCAHSSAYGLWPSCQRVRPDTSIIITFSGKKTGGPHRGRNAKGCLRGPGPLRRGKRRAVRATGSGSARRARTRARLRPAARARS